MSTRMHINLKAAEIIAACEVATTVEEAVGFRAEFEVRLAKNATKLAARKADGANTKGLESKIAHLKANTATVQTFVDALSPKAKKGVKATEAVVPSEDGALYAFLSDPKITQKAKLEIVKAMTAANA